MFRIILPIQILIASATLMSAQDSTSVSSENIGTIKYEAFDKFDLSFFEGSDQKTTEWLASMPKGVKIAKVLCFDNEFSLFEIDKNINIKVVWNTKEREAQWLKFIMTKMQT